MRETKRLTYSMAAVHLDLAFHDLSLANSNLKSIDSLSPMNNRNDDSTTCVQLSLILLAYENGDCPAISVHENGSNT